MHSFYLAVLGLMATSSLAAPKKAAQEGINVFDAMAKLKSGPHVYVHIADDGVARAYDENESVIDYVPLTNNQLKQLLANLPEPWKKEADHLHAVFDDIDGRQVTDKKQLLDPPAELRNPMPRQAPHLTITVEANSAVMIQLANSWAAESVIGWIWPIQEHRVFAFSEAYFLLPSHLATSIDRLKDDEPSPFPLLRHSPSNKGFTHLATDGVIRSFSSSGEVIDYKKSSPAEIIKMLEFFGKYMDPEAFEEVRKKFKGVDGRNVTDLEQLLHPEPGICPAEFNK
ncbi:hypothetical protein BDV23DRAFT_171767 [Aspergillus alliaceus]|uniref:Uncharacterized protein n=1 Tax=Petromyces alliaceus TaxID=209559 RepID=A0A5N7CBC4_PETAA|nr:hypothetical protein BDV23DRAFT_171767 [Aspergillus alliaceus]